MSRKFLVTLASVGVIVLAGCGSSSKSSSTTAPPTAATPTLPTTEAPAATAAPATTTLGIGQTAMGRVLVDARGYTIYTFGHDAVGSGTSACTGQCATEWPPVLATGTPTAAAGVSGTLGRIPRSGGMQVTLDGHPLYTFSGDHAAGTTNGEGIGGVWHAVTLTAAGTATSPTTAKVNPPAATSAPTTPPTTARVTPATPAPTPAPTSPPTTARPTPTTKPAPYGY